VPELKKVLETTLCLTKFTKMIAFLRDPAAQKVRTNNHVERCNRKLRYWEKVRYKWRRRRTLVRFLVLAMDAWWQRTLPQLEAVPAAASPTVDTAKEKQPTRREESNAFESKPPVAPLPDTRRKAA
jgi:hypothetical protein